jgi:hypothetical protein
MLHQSYLLPEEKFRQVLTHIDQITGERTISLQSLLLQ